MVLGTILRASQILAHLNLLTKTLVIPILWMKYGWMDEVIEAQES